MKYTNNYKTYLQNIVTLKSKGKLKLNNSNKQKDITLNK